MVQRLRLPEQNKVTLVGRLTHDPELRYTQKGQAVCRFSIAIGRRFKDSNGAWQEETCFVPVVTWQEIALRCNERLKKGSPVYVHGRLRSRSWEDKEGQKRTILEVQSREIQFLQVTEKEEGQESKPGSAGAQSAQSAQGAPGGADTGETVEESKDQSMTEDIPF